MALLSKSKIFGGKKMWIGSSALDSELYFDELFTKPAVKRIRAKLRGASEEELEKVIQKYQSKPWYQKLARYLFFDGPGFYEENLTFLCARDMLDGTFSWEEYDKAQEEKEQKRKALLEEEILRRAHISKAKKIEFFPESLEEYISLKGEEYERIEIKDESYRDLALPNSSLFIKYNPFSADSQLLVGKLGVEALVHSSEVFDMYTEIFNGIAGIPVKKKVQEAEN